MLPKDTMTGIFIFVSMWKSRPTDRQTQCTTVIHLIAINQIHPIRFFFFVPQTWFGSVFILTLTVFHWFTSPFCSGIVGQKKAISEITWFHDCSKTNKKNFHSKTHNWTPLCDNNCQFGAPKQSLAFKYLFSPLKASNRLWTWTWFTILINYQLGYGKT